MKIFWEIIIIWLIMIFVLTMVSFAYMPRTATAVASAWTDAIVSIVLAVIDIYFYKREQKVQA